MHTPLADQIRPSTLDDVVGQRQLLGESLKAEKSPT